jgi:2-iminobutanoate/2-iminopropanoate deaminase
MPSKVISSPHAPEAIGPYVQARQVGSLLFTSGQLPLTQTGDIVEGGMAAQTRQVITNLQAVVEAAGASLADTVKATVFLTDLSQFGAYNAVFAEMFGVHKPARSTIEVAKLPKDALVEIELIVEVADDKIQN